MASLFDRRLLILSGKGGVGRTTVAAALARAAAARGKRVLIAQTDAVERLGKMLGRSAPIGPTVVDVAPGISAVNMTPRESLHQYALMVLRYETVYRALFDNRVVRGFLSAIPGLDAYAMLGKAWWHTTEEAKGPSGGRRWMYDLVILDGPATGHATAMLKIPRAIIEAVPAGPLARDARTMSELLSDPARTALVIVTRPEELPAGETVELATTARGTLNIALGPLIVNAVPASRFTTEPLSSALDRLRDVSDDDRLGRTVALALGQRAQRRTAEAVLASLEKNPGLPLVLLPWLPSTALGPAEIDRLSSALAASPAITPAG